MPIIRLPVPAASGAERFRGILEKTTSPFVYWDQLQSRVDAEVNMARGKAVQYNGNADHLETKVAEYKAKEEEWAKKLAKSGNTDPDLEMERGAAARAANNTANEMNRYRSGARQWTDFADALEGELANLKAQSAAAAQPSS